MHHYTSNPYNFGPGKFYIGDLCYVMHPEWDEVCDITIDGSKCKEGVFELSDGREFGMWGTAHGDGTYSDGKNEYSVDSGTIGVIHVDDITDKDEFEGVVEIGLGHVITFENSFRVFCEDGVFHFGNIIIDTNYEDEDEEEFYKEYDY
jgi:hypothetical protein